jgi:hypothetical protein
MKKQLILIFVSILLITTVFMTNQVKGVTGDITITDWESFNLGLTTGSNSFMHFDVVDTNGANSLIKAGGLSGKCLSLINNGATVARLYVNFTSNYTYISSIHIWITQVGSCIWAIDMYNATDKVIILTSDGSNFKYDPIDAAATTFASFGATEDGWLNITHVSGNTMNYTWWNVATGITDYKEGGSDNTADWSSITRIVFNQNANAEGQIDNIIINTETTSSGGYGSLAGYTPICSGGLGLYTQMSYTETIGGTVIPWYPSPIIIGGSSTTYPSKYIEHEFPYTWSGTIYGVDLPVNINQLTYVSNDTNDYWLTINGIPSFGHPDYILPTTGGEYVLRWIYETGITFTHEKPLFAFYCDSHTIGLSKDWYWYGVGISYTSIGSSLTHNDNVWYADNFFNGYVPDSGDISMCYYVTTDTTKQGEEGLSDIELINYTGLYGYMFIEFYENTFSCYHGIGSNPHIMYYLNDTYLEADSPFYRYQIMQVGTNIAVYDGLISMTGTHKDAKLRIMDYKFTQKGQYYIVLYNTTDYGTVLGSELYYSQVITVCDVGLGDPVTDTDTGGMIGLDFSGIPIFFKVIIALLIIVVLTICPYFLVVMIGRGTDNHIELPALVYVAFFFIGVVASVMLGFLEAWVFFVIFFGLILTLAIFWIRGKSGEGGE